MKYLENSKKNKLVILAEKKWDTLFEGPFITWEIIDQFRYVFLWIAKINESNMALTNLKYIEKILLPLKKRNKNMHRKYVIVCVCILYSCRRVIGIWTPMSVRPECGCVHARACVNVHYYCTCADMTWAFELLSLLVLGVRDALCALTDEWHNVYADVRECTFAFACFACMCKCVRA